MAAAPVLVSSLDKVLKFGKFDIPREHAFAASKLSYAFVNLKPLAEGHVLVSPRRVVKRFKDLQPAEVADLWQLAQRVAAAIETAISADSMSLVIQDGPAAGQSVPHVHIHCLPRFFKDIPNNDEIYDMIDDSERGQAAELAHRGERLGNLDIERKPRSHEEMAAEAKQFEELILAHSG